MYYDRLDRMYIKSSQFLQNQWLYVDPLAADATPPAVGYFTGGPSAQGLMLGEHDPINNVQDFYFSFNSGNGPLELGVLATMTSTGSFPFDASVQMIASDGIGSGTDGYRDQGAGRMVFFESAVNPRTGMTGYALQTFCRVRSFGDSVQYEKVLAQIDLNDGLSDIVPELYPTTEGFIVSYVTAPHQYQGPSRFGNRFTFEHIQFIPDITDAEYNPATPKGVLFFATADDTGGETGTNLRIGTLGAGSTCRIYVKYVEWNPDGVVAGPGEINRVHGRELVFTRYEVLEQSDSSAGGIGTDTVGMGKQYDRETPWFHPPSGQLIHFFRALGGSDHKYVTVPGTPQLDQISPPTAFGVVETGRTVTFSVDTIGDLGERIPSIDIDWSLERISTFREDLDTVGLPATSTVGQPPIDAGTLVVERDDGTGPVVLTLTTDYTVVESTGVITWQGSHPNLEAGYTATYQHATNPTTPAHGNLITTLSTSDLDGQAIARVQYPDDSDLVGQRDRLTAEQAS